ncbi:hypothetical protein JK203_14550 [Gluconobacter cerinus]|uniref:hypothetical protein n=1 Tax=Gluconobacter cerinus TaxID=38307 RepID=UPI001B8C9D65|nr:hypothetical protein [Gluconobacter cerinus]MBS1042054.1 hypothetical protein [Gluconobacter cerinus]MBS1048652.1 hypothetical protein [Gluconobacter cerinus]
MGSDVAPACPEDVFGTDLVGAWGVDAVVAAFTGPAFDVTTTVAGASVVTTVPITEGRKHDTGVLSRALIVGYQVTEEHCCFSCFRHFYGSGVGRWAGMNAASDERIQLLTVGSVSTISGINEDSKLGVYDGTSYVHDEQPAGLSGNPSAHLPQVFVLNASGIQHQVHVANLRTGTVLARADTG